MRRMCNIKAEYFSQWEILLQENASLMIERTELKPRSYYTMTVKWSWWDEQHKHYDSEPSIKLGSYPKAQERNQKIL